MAEEFERKSHYEQSAVVPFRVADGGVQVLLITSMKSKKWIVPKGIVEPHLDAKQSAAVEAEEEAGVRGDVLDIVLGSYSYQKWGGLCTVEVYAMRVTDVLDDWLEAEDRDRVWVSLDEAEAMVKPKDLQPIVGRVREVVEQS